MDNSHVTIVQMAGFKTGNIKSTFYFSFLTLSTLNVGTR